MPQVNWSVDLGDLVVAVLGLVFIPVTRALIRTLWSVRMAVEELTVAVFGTEKDRSIGIIAHVADLRKEHKRHRNWLFQIASDIGSKLEDRS